jgi:hypothetical protein
VEEANRELARLLEPALEAGLRGAQHDPERLSGTDACSNPLTGPRQGVRPGVEYRIPIEVLGSEPERFVIEAEKVWREMGLETRADETESNLTRLATKPGYSLSASVNFANKEALLIGSGPCVDDPES